MDPFPNIEGPRILAAQIGSDMLCQAILGSKNPSNNKMIDTKKIAKIPILILDSSGSMGNWVQTTINSWQTALRRLNYPEEHETIIIKFESNTKITRHKLKQLDKLKMRSKGGTCIAGVPEELARILETSFNFDLKSHDLKHKSANRDKLFNIWMVSDGEILDNHDFKQAMRKYMRPYFNSQNIHVCGIRLNYREADTDTEALCAIGLLSSQDFILQQLEKGDSTLVGDKMVDLMTEIRSSDNNFTVTTTSPCLAKRPGDRGKADLTLKDENYFIAYGSNPNISISIEGEIMRVEIIEAGDIPKLLDNYASKTYFRLVQEKIADIYENTAHIDALIKIYKEMDNLANTVKRNLIKNKTTASRARNILKRFTKRQKTIRQKIAELRNRTDINKITGNQQSDLLRQLDSNSKKDTSLIKRYLKASNGTDPQATMYTAINKCREQLNELKKSEEEIDPWKEPQCFISLETSLESAMTAAEQGETLMKENIAIDQILTLYGLHGIAIQHKIANYTDPMLLGLNQGVNNSITKIYPGVILNQALMWDAKLNNYTVTAPGFDESSTITAVIPIMAWNHPMVWQLYTQDTEIANLQASANIRQTITPIVRDRQALNASLMLKMLADWGIENPSNIQEKTMSELLQTLQSDTPNETTKTITEALMGEEPDSKFTTENGLASELAPFCFILCNPCLLSFLGGSNSGQLWRALISNTIYWSIKKLPNQNINKNELVKTLLGIKEEHYTIPKPKEEDENETPTFHDLWDQEIEKQYLLKNSFLQNIQFYCKFLTLAQRYNKTCGSTEDIFRGKITFKNNLESATVQMDFGFFCFAHAVRSFMTTSENERFNMESINKLESLTPEQQVTSFLKCTIRNIYKEIYEKALKEKEIAIHESKLQTFMEEFPTLHFDEFATKLKIAIPNEYHKGFSDLMKTILNNTEKTVDLAEKLQLLLLGSLYQHNWNNHSTLRKNIQIKALLSTLIDKTRMEEINKLVKDHHRYREKQNRHGYGNHNPSFWACTYHSTPWSFLKNNEEGYNNWLRTLRRMQNGNEIEQLIFGKWSHLLLKSPRRDNVYAKV